VFQNSDSEKRLRNSLEFFLSLSLIAPGFEKHSPLRGSSTRRQVDDEQTTRRGDMTTPVGAVAEGEESRGGGNRRRLRASWEQEMVGFTVTLMGCEPGLLSTNC
jgi:hypothetical protein